MEGSNIVLSAPLQQLKDEHVSLRADMNLFYDIIEDIEYVSGHEVVQLFSKLFKMITTFTEKLNAHSIKEEEGLFPMMTRYPNNDRIIAEMECEHEKAEQHLQNFLTEANKEGPSIDETDVQWITVFAFQAHATLVQHFAKEEKVLFPLAESILTNNDKNELKQIFQPQ